jgi:hypothetical protein
MSHSLELDINISLTLPQHIQNLLHAVRVEDSESGYKINIIHLWKQEEVRKEVSLLFWSDLPGPCTEKVGFDESHHLANRASIMHQL